MRASFSIIVSAAALFLSLAPASAQDKRVALVIGNAAYKNVFALKNPVNDANDMAAALSRIGFAVTILTDATADETRRGLAAFGEKAKTADTAFVFFAGHAIQSGDVNWLMPVDGSADTLIDVTNHSVSLDQILEQMAGVGQLAIVILDVARNDPFADPKAKRPDAKRSAGKIDTKPTPESVVLGFATGPGRKVADGEGRNSPYTAALLKHLETPGQDILLILRKVRDEVAAVTKGDQIPFSYGSLKNDNVVLVPR